MDADGGRATAAERPSRARRTQAERVEQTRGALVAAGRRLFAAEGFAAVTLEQVVAAAGVTRGALYHHFSNKSDLFRSVYLQVETEAVEEMAVVIGEVTDIGNDIRKAVAAYLDVCQRPDVRRIALLDAPAVLGWQTWRELEADLALGLMVARLAMAQEDGVRLAASPEVLSPLLLSVAMEAALMIAVAEDPVAARTEAEGALVAMLAGVISDDRTDETT